MPIFESTCIVCGGGLAQSIPSSRMHKHSTRDSASSSADKFGCT